MLTPLPELNVMLCHRRTFASDSDAAQAIGHLMGHPHFAPNRYGALEPLKPFGPESVQEAIDILTNKEGQSAHPHRVSSFELFARRGGSRTSYHIGWSHSPHRTFDVSRYSISNRSIRDASCLAEWVEFTLEAAAIHEAWYAAFTLGVEWHAKNVFEWRALTSVKGRRPLAVGTTRGVGTQLYEGIPGVYWGNYLGPFYVDWFGRNRLETLPCLEKRWLPTGGLFYTTAPTPFGWDTHEARACQHAVREHLGSETFFDMQAFTAAVRAAEPLPEELGLRPERLLPPRHVPDFPFTVTFSSGSLEDELRELTEYFTGEGYVLVEREDERTLVFRDETGGITRVVAGSGGRIKSWPRQ